MIGRMYDFSDPRRIVRASKVQLREKCRVLSDAETKYDSFLIFPEEEQKVPDLDWPELPGWWHLTHLYLRMFAWGKSSVRCRVGPEELDEFWKFMSNNGKRDHEGIDKNKILDAVVEVSLWERDEEGALWSYDLCRDYLARSWLTATEIFNVLQEVIDESKGQLPKE